LYYSLNKKVSFSIAEFEFSTSAAQRKQKDEGKKNKHHIIFAKLISSGSHLENHLRTVWIDLSFALFLIR